MFSVVSVCSQGVSHVAITHDALDLRPPPLRRTCSNLLNLDFTIQGHPQVPLHKDPPPQF